jgi:FkbH-like protein
MIPSFNQLIKNTKQESINFPSLKVALLGDSSTQLLAKSLQGYGIELGYDIDLYEADYDQVSLQVLNKGSELYQSKANYVIIAESNLRLKQSYYKSSDRIGFAENKLEGIKQLVSHLSSEDSLKMVLYFNFQEDDDSVYGNYANKIESSFLYQIRKLNFLLMEYSCSESIFHIVDYKKIHERLGDKAMFSPSFYVSSSMVFNLEALPILSKNCLDIILAQAGVFKKCVILDLDNTMWGGVIGDDGISKIQIGNLGIGKAFTIFQQWVKELKERGIILAVCSKNYESVAKDVFENHPEMIIRLPDIAVFIANWDNKADNIKYIQSILNIGFDSMVFLDDNKFERELVKSNIPELTVPDLPEDPAEYVNYLKVLNLFETASYAQNDTKRTRQYQAESERKKEEIKYSDQSSFLENLNMVAEIEKLNTFNLPRVAQLIQRSNQFNLRTIRYAESDLVSLIDSNSKKCIAVKLKDSFGDYGIISVLVLDYQEEELFIDSWVMSCRVLKRGVEEFVFNTILELVVGDSNVKRIKGEYIPTKKNIFVSDLFSKLGFNNIGDYWIYNIQDSSEVQEKKCYIKREEK